MLTCLLIGSFTWLMSLNNAADAMSYKLLATNKTSTMEKEMNDTAAQGFKFVGTMGGETMGGNEIVVIMQKGTAKTTRYEYKLLATRKTSTMEKELNEAGAQGFNYVGQTIYESTFGGREVIVIMERQPDVPNSKYGYKLQATNRTGTMEKELNAVGANGYELCNVTVAKTSFGGNEVVAILRKQIN
jgi:hypothetical protein